MKNIFDYFSLVPDPRRGEGQRHSLELCLIIVLMSVMSGYNGYRAIGDFIERNKEDLLLYFKPKKDRLPTFFTIRRILLVMDFGAFSAAFYNWAIASGFLNGGDLVSVDGKAIRGTVIDGKGSKQDFINLVSFYASERGMVVANGKIANGKESEIGVVQVLIKELGLQGMTFTLDALHCQKKRLTSL